jgi:amino acid adenylation domain-containing protein
VYNLSKELSYKLRKTSNKERVSVFVLLLNILKVLLYKYSGKLDTVRSLIPNRPYKCTQELMGILANTLVPKNQISGKKVFKKLLKETKEITLNGYKNRGVPVAQLLDYFNIGKSLNKNPIVHVIFMLHELSKKKIALDDVEVENIIKSSNISPVDLFVVAYDDGEIISLSLEYSNHLFEETTIKRMAKHYEQIAKGLMYNINQQIRSVEILTKEEKIQILGEWNNTQKNYSENKCIHELFEEEVRLNPDKIAVVYEDYRVTYEELNKRANQLARYLRQKGVCGDVLVGIGIKKSIEMIVGILAVLKAGGGYVPLDPGFEEPDDRLNYMLNNSNCLILLTQSGIKEKFNTYGEEGDIIEIDLWQKISTESSDNLGIIIAGSNIAYVIYTSGSTGRPKAVMIEHRSLTNIVVDMLYRMNFCDLDRLLNITKIPFDIAGLELYLPLISGNKILILPLTKLIKERVNLIQVTPRVLENMLKYNLTLPTNLRVICGGENVPRVLINKLSQNISLDNILVVYGPTETTIWSSAYNTKSNILNSPNLPIGRPIINTSIYILDNDLNLVPVGVTGEIYIGGIGLARGYLNKPDLTSEKFIANPFASVKDVRNGKNLRLYKSGDLGKYLPDGNIECVGRIDNQIKINGYRIEPGEVEAALNSCVEVFSAVVMTRKVVLSNNNTTPHKRLVVYIVPQDTIKSELEILVSHAKYKVLGGPQLDQHVESIKAQISKVLPEYMIPLYFIFLDSIPLNINGKLDKEALPYNLYNI